MEAILSQQQQQQTGKSPPSPPASSSSALCNSMVIMKKVHSIPTFRANSHHQQHAKALRRAQSCQKLQKPLDPESPEAIVRNTLGVKRPNPATLFSRVPPTEARLEAFTNEKVDAVRNNDVQTLQRMHQQGQSLDACSKNGESLLHLACRRGNIETVQFLVQVVPATIQDELGRTVLHDVCWRPRPDPAMFMVVFHAVPRSFLLTPDARGHTCFDYCRKPEWPLWNAYFKEHLPCSSLDDESCEDENNGPVDPF